MVWIEREVRDGVLILTGEFRTLSSSLLGGGLAVKRHLLNAQVPHGYASADPWLDVEERVRRLGLPLEACTAMMTAADVEHVVERSMAGEEFALRTFVTAGVGNAARAGKKRKTYAGYVAGTINIIVAIDARLSDAALVNALITVTEAKAAALQELGVTDREGQVATGTTTDSVILAVNRRTAFTGVHHYAGVATELGNGIGVSVHNALTAALTQKGGTAS